MDKRIKLKITDNTNKNIPLISKFAISYSGKKMDNSEVSYEIISALKEDKDMIIELNSSLLNLDGQGKTLMLERFTGQLDRLGVEYKNKKVMVNTRRVILSISLDSRQIEGFELYAHIPDGIWKAQEFKKTVPEMGVRYYIVEKNSESNLDAFAAMNEEERHKMCSMVIFDHMSLGSMGINAARLTKHDIDELLK